jgi:hypothetical protein
MMRANAAKAFIRGLNSIENFRFNWTLTLTMMCYIIFNFKIEQYLSLIIDNKHFIPTIKIFVKFFQKLCNKDLSFG